MAEQSRSERLKKFATEIRINTLKEFREIGFGHVGGSMSVADTLAVLYGEIMRIDPKKPRWEDRDQFIMSKGHAGPALYATLALKGYFPVEDLATLNQNGTTLPSHCDRNKTCGVDMSNGSLGQGLSAGIGIALSARLKKNGAYCYVMLGDGECDEGQVWEGVLFAAHHKVSNLVAFVDYNKQQLDGYTCNICDLGDLARKFADFGWFAQDIDGHDVDAIIAAIDKAKAQSDKPAAIILNTIKGKDASFAEGILGNHHMVVTKETIDAAIAKLSGKETA